MAELISMTYEEARAEHFKALKDEAKRKMNYWATRVRHSRPNDLNDPAHIKASEYGAEYSYYKDALEALAAQPKWISVEERIPEDNVDVIVYIASKKENVDSVIAITQYTHRMYGYNLEGWCSPWQYCFWDREVTHWMPLPSMPELPKEYA